MCGVGPMQFYGPRGLKLNNYKLYVCDSDNHRIQVFDTELNYITFIGGGRGSGPGQFNEPRDVSFDDMLHVANYYNNRIQVLDQEGKLYESMVREAMALDNCIGLPLYILTMTTCVCQ